MFNKINEELKKAMKEKNELRLSTLRMLKSKILYVNARGELPEAEITKIIIKYSKELKESIEEFKKVERTAEVARHEQELKIVAEFLPPELSADEVKKIVAQTIKETGAASIKEMGKVMKEISGKHAGVDGKLVSQLVREALQ
ncbi:hypothetical protein A3H38_03225 [candidate division WOR-1 bacterium RIFCSPLOWO2_02_FULL_46_20]|uniref:Glutamyl-tRNA amidotransferase n=2 Tax=Saganbacteria TaxID=1703751 RepID=A0A1F4RGA2_UNCSA|nr:MAG: hypothetical protein A3J44_02590 [candidate division WOR-1 bacterium RIFCSPHIGHO2_02_FULL_45_12]OGC07200.1 MAG: hypothetical protein A3H38_03225 [candidate division WOR-1 bacterium RIFCSPLOWO2_02_FULL_46_20]OGC09954.1 MAG: hypothetical protein A3F86_03000 [candidate division WOR-1 bacterium RIFCSPLOWO2_12_FULL_45_9]